MLFLLLTKENLFYYLNSTCILFDSIMSVALLNYLILLKNPPNFGMSHMLIMFSSKLEITTM